MRVGVCTCACGEPGLVKCAVISWKKNVKARLYGQLVSRRTRRSLNLVCHVPCLFATFRDVAS